MKNSQVSVKDIPHECLCMQVNTLFKELNNFSLPPLSHFQQLPSQDHLLRCQIQVLNFQDESVGHTFSDPVLIWVILLFLNQTKNSVT